MSTDEFDQVATWTVEAIAHLGDDHAIAGACRGSGGPGAMTWLSSWLLAGPSGPFLDLGGGLGGPSAWLHRHHDVQPVLVEPMARAAAGARQLFSTPSAMADGARLPFPDETFAALWALGVLSTAPHFDTVLTEAARVLRPDGRLGLVAYVADGSSAVDEPEGNHFPTRRELSEALSSAGLRPDDSATLEELPPAGETWDSRADAVDRLVAERHRDARTWQDSRRDEDHLASLLEEGRVSGLALRLVPMSV